MHLSIKRLEIKVCSSSCLYLDLVNIQSVFNLLLIDTDISLHAATSSRKDSVTASSFGLFEPLNKSLSSDSFWAQVSMELKEITSAAGNLVNQYRNTQIDFSGWTKWARWALKQMLVPALSWWSHPEWGPCLGYGGCGNSGGSSCWTWPWALGLWSFPGRLYPWILHKKSCWFESGLLCRLVPGNQDRAGVAGKFSLGQIGGHCPECCWQCSLSTTHRRNNNF